MVGYTALPGLVWYNEYYKVGGSDDKGRMMASLKNAYQKFLDMGVEPGETSTAGGIMPDIGGIMNGWKGGNQIFKAKCEYHFAVCTAGGGGFLKGDVVGFACIHVLSPRHDMTQPPLVYIAHICGMIGGVGLAIYHYLRDRYPGHAFILEVVPPHVKLLRVYRRWGFGFAAGLEEGDAVRALLQSIHDDRRLGVLIYADGMAKGKQYISPEALTTGYTDDDTFGGGTEPVWMVVHPVAVLQMGLHQEAAAAAGRPRRGLTDGGEEPTYTRRSTRQRPN